MKYLYFRLKSELESANSWKDRLQESREHDTLTKVQLEEKVSKLECDRVLAEEKLAAEIASAKYSNCSIFVFDPNIISCFLIFSVES